MARRNPRHPRIDYSNGWFLVTVVAAGRRHHFGAVRDRQVILSAVGIHVSAAIDALADRTGTELDAWVVMPNHVHLIVHVQRRPLGVVIGGCKARAVRACRKAGVWKPATALWHVGYHDRSIRTGRGLDVARAYVLANPSRWSR